MRKYYLILSLLIIILCLLLILVGALLLSQESLAWRLESLWAEIKYALKPPERVVFSPQPTLATRPPITLISTDLPSPTATLALITLTPTRPPNTPTLAPTATLTPTPLPSSAKLTGIRHEYQMWNNCGPANLAMALSFWGWRGDQRQTAAFLKPNKRDKNVMPYEMEAFIEQETNLQAVVRVGGDLLMLKAFVSAGYPVLAEKGFEGVGFDGWMGHYQVVSGYDDATQRLFTQDSYKGPDLPIAYDDFIAQWRAFNYTYLVIYPPEQKNQVLDILGLQAYDNFNYHYAEQKARDEISLLTGRDLYFALFNQGTNLVYLQDYTAAATAYDAAFANYPLIPEAIRPWRMLWYQTGPYFAYYYTGRYQDVINLATLTLDAMSEPILEESYYWRGRAKLALADQEGAVKDFQTCLDVHQGFSPCVEQLKLLGIEP